MTAPTSCTVYHVTCDAWDTVAVTRGNNPLDALSNALESIGVPWVPSDTTHNWFHPRTTNAVCFRIRGVVYTVEAMR